MTDSAGPDFCQGSMKKVDLLGSLFLRIDRCLGPSFKPLASAAIVFISSTGPHAKTVEAKIKSQWPSLASSAPEASGPRTGITALVPLTASPRP
jgi:hypothetical protein